MAIIVEAVEDVRLPNDLPRAVLHHKLARLVGTSSSLATASASFYVCLFVLYTQGVLVQLPLCNVGKLSDIPVRNPSYLEPMSKGKFVESPNRCCFPISSGKLINFPFDIGSQYFPF